MLIQGWKELEQSTRLQMNTKITLKLTPSKFRFLRYVAELEGLTVEQYLLRFAKGQIVHR